MATLPTQADAEAAKTAYLEALGADSAAGGIISVASAGVSFVPVIGPIIAQVANIVQQMVPFNKAAMAPTFAAKIRALSPIQRYTALLMVKIIADEFREQKDEPALPADRTVQAAAYGPFRLGHTFFESESVIVGQFFREELIRFTTFTGSSPKLCQQLLLILASGDDDSRKLKDCIWVDTLASRKDDVGALYRRNKDITCGQVRQDSARMGVDLIMSVPFGPGSYTPPVARPV